MKALAIVLALLAAIHTSPDVGACWSRCEDCVSRCHTSDCRDNCTDNNASCCEARGKRGYYRSCGCE